MSETKNCSKCGEEKPLDAEHFVPSDKTLSGFEECRECRALYNREWRAKRSRNKRDKRHRRYDVRSPTGEVYGVDLKPGRAVTIALRAMRDAPVSVTAVDVFDNYFHYDFRSLSWERHDGEWTLVRGHKGLLYPIVPQWAGGRRVLTPSAAVTVPPAVDSWLCTRCCTRRTRDLFLGDPLCRWCKSIRVREFIGGTVGSMSKTVAGRPFMRGRKAGFTDL